MSLPLVFRVEARDEIDAAYAWYEQQRTGLGERYLAALRTALDGIEENPAIHGFVHRDIRAAMLRRFPYVIYYRIESERVVVLAVQHGSRHPRDWESRA